MMGFGLFLFLVVVVMEMAPSSVLGELRVGRALEEGRVLGRFLFQWPASFCKPCSFPGPRAPGCRDGPNAFGLVALRPPMSSWCPGPFLAPGPVHGTRITLSPGLFPSQGCHFQTPCPFERKEVTLGTQFYGARGVSTLAP